jgi:hypothetical protein
MRLRRGGHAWAERFFRMPRKGRRIPARQAWIEEAVSWEFGELEI